MADTLNFGPEWLRVLSDGNSVGTPPPSPGILGKYKLADYRYGREEMLALSNVDGVEVPEDLKNFTAIYVEKPLEPISLQNLTEEEQRLMSQSVNSTAVLRMHGRGAPPGVRGRGGIERGRGRGRGRGEGGFFQRGMSAEEGGGFGRPPTHSRSDGWEEVGPKRNFQTRYEEGSGPPQRQFHRSLSNENWRDRTGEEEEEDGDWRKAGNKWNTRTNWREPITRGGFDSDRHQPNGIQRGGFDRDKGRSYQRGRISESWDDEENLPEWSMPDTEGEDVGTFDASGAFVSTKKKPGDKETDNKEDKKDNSKDKEEQKESDKNKSPDKVKVDTKEKVENKDKVKTPPPRVKKEEKQPTESESKENKKPDAKNYTVTSEPSKESKPPNIEKPSVNSSPKQENNSAIKNLTERNGKTNVSLKKEAAEAETLARLQEAAENVVLSAMTAEVQKRNPQKIRDEEKTVVPPAKETSTALPVDHEDAHKWFYKDPQGDMQGPFTSNEMAEWFSAGYFTMNLHVKRGCDEKISPLGELIKSWGRVPFLPGPAPPPALNTPTSQPDQQEQMKALQQLLVQQQLMQQQFLMRQLQMQQIQQVMQQLQDNEQFKNLPPVQQQQLAMQLMMKQSPVPVVPQTQMQNLSPRSPPNESVSPSNPSHPAFQRSVSQPNNTPKEEGPSIWDTNTQKQNTGAWSQPQSVWDIDPKVAITNTELEMQIEKARKEKEEQLERLRLEKEEEERRIQEELKRHQTEMMKQQEELMRQKEEMERQKQEIEKQRQLEMQRLEEIRRKGQEEEERKRREMEEQERRRKEEEMRREEEMRQKQEEAMRKKQEEDMRRESELRQHQQRQMLEHQKQQQELEERQKQQELQRRQEEARQQQELRQRQQQEALKKLQQEQMANMQLPQHAQWASQQASLEQQKAKSLLEIQEQEERERLKQEEIQRQLEAQRQQMMALQQQQQQQKSWSSQIFPSQSSSKSLIEIQEEQARQLQQERQRKQQQQQTQTKTMSISAASAWGGGNSSTHWASEGAWGNQARNMGNGAGSLGFWDDAIISSKRATPPNNKNVQGNPAEFPALKGGNQSNVPSVPVSKTQKPSKMKKEEEAVQRLFKQPQPQQNDFLQWCEKALRSLDTSVDIPTFIAFLTEVESPYEVHDYVRSYLGETKHSKDFAKQFLEKRSQSRNKAKPPVVEESIWGPAPARDYRQPTNQSTETDSQKSKGGKKKKKMMKIDSSILGFTVSADPERKNVGELEDDVK